MAAPGPFHELLTVRISDRGCDVDESAQQITGFVSSGGDGVKGPSSGTGRPAFFRSRKLARQTTAF